jgi:hypothetical protein
LIAAIWIVRHAADALDKIELLTSLTETMFLDEAIEHCEESDDINPPFNYSERHTGLGQQGI